MAKSVEHLRALQMRREGKSVKEIAHTLHVSTGTASKWCALISLTAKQRDILRTRAIAAGHKGRLIGAKINKDRRIRAQQDAQDWAHRKMSQMNKRELLAAGTALYWGEGTKSHQLTFTNSDPQMILFMLRWFQDAHNIETENFMPRIYINIIHYDRARTVLSFWSRLLRIPKKQFKKTIFIRTKQNKRYENHERYYGILALRMRNSTIIKYRTLALIDALKSAKVAQW